MLKRFLTGFLCATCAISVLTSCGEKSGGTGEFATVYATATTPASSLDSDVAIWVDATTGAKSQPCLATSVPTVLPDALVYTVTSAAYAVPNTGSTSTIVPSDLIINKITLTLTPDNNLSPALPAMYQTQFLSSGQRIVVGTNSVTVRIAKDELKSYLQPSLDCTGLIFSYRAVVSFEALEVTTNRVSTITPSGYLLVNFSDYFDK